MYRRAMRHSRNVRVLRLAIPLTIVLGGLATIVVATWLDPLRALAKLPVDAAGLVVSGTRITMQQPRMAGFTRDARPYVVTASTATQDLLNPDTLELQDIHAIMEMVDKTKFDLTDSQVAYAASDVLHLHALKGKLDAMLAREGRHELAAACYRFLPDRVRLDLAGWAEEDIFAPS